MADNGKPSPTIALGGSVLKWNQRYSGVTGTLPQAARVLRDNVHLLPTSGDALDLACGLGGNALLAAQRGLTVAAWDFSAVAIDTLARVASAAGLSVVGEVRDVIASPPEADSFDVIMVSRYLERGLAPALVRTLRPGGLLFYQTFTTERVDEHGPRNPAFRLQTNELLALFAELQLLVYREEGRVGDIASGFRNEAMLVGRKRQ